MTIAVNGSTASDTNIVTKSDPRSLGKDDFLKLLVTQLKNQDPLNPASSTEFVAQLAQFSSLEQLSNVNENLKIVQSYNQSINNLQAVNFMGKTVKSIGSMFSLGPNGSSNMDYQLSENANAVFINIYDSTGKHVREIRMNQMAAGDHKFEWDGLDENGKPADLGVYSFTVKAKNQYGEIMNTAAYVEHTVTGVSYHNGNTYLKAKDVEIPYSAVIGVTDPKFR